MRRATQLPNNFNSNRPGCFSSLPKRSPSKEPGKGPCLSPDHFRSHNEAQGTHIQSESLPPADNTRDEPSKTSRARHKPYFCRLNLSCSLSYLPDSEPPLKVTADLKGNAAPRSSQNSGRLRRGRAEEMSSVLMVVSLVTHFLNSFN